jgi:hypothetical protein
MTQTFLDAYVHDKVRARLGHNNDMGMHSIEAGHLDKAPLYNGGQQEEAADQAKGPSFTWIKHHT